MDTAFLPQAIEQPKNEEIYKQIGGHQYETPALVMVLKNKQEKKQKPEGDGRSK